jgi:hypothetical protein
MPDVTPRDRVVPHMHKEATEWLGVAASDQYGQQSLMSFPLSLKNGTRGVMELA